MRKFSLEDQIWLLANRIKPDSVPDDFYSPVDPKAPEASGPPKPSRQREAPTPRPTPAPSSANRRPIQCIMTYAGPKLTLTPPHVLKFLRTAPKSVHLDALVSAFGEDVMVILPEMINGHLVKCWGPGQVLFYIEPESKPVVDEIIKKAGL